jgi:hypothetical protein
MIELKGQTHDRTTSFFKEQKTPKTKTWPAPKARQPLARVSPQKSAWHKKYITALKKAIAADPKCRRCRNRSASQGHHPEGQMGAKIMIFSPFCVDCHRDVEDNKNQSRKDGWITYK